MWCCEKLNATDSVQFVPLNNYRFSDFKMKYRIPMISERPVHLWKWKLCCFQSGCNSNCGFLLFFSPLIRPPQGWTHTTWRSGSSHQLLNVCKRSVCWSIVTGRSCSRVLASSADWPGITFWPACYSNMWDGVEGSGRAHIMSLACVFITPEPQRAHLDQVHLDFSF